MTNLPRTNECSAAQASRELSQDELSLIHGSEGGRPTPPSAGTPTASRETSHRINPNGPPQRSGSAIVSRILQADCLNFASHSGFRLTAELLNALRFLS